MDLHTLGRVLVVVGIGIAILGGALLLLARLPIFGSLPGDIRVEGQGFSCFVPIASMIVISIVVTIVLNIIIRLINRP